MVRLSPLICFLILVSSAFSQEVKTVEGEYIYHAPENVSVEDARRISLDRAKIQALADAFGTIVSQTNATHISNKNGKSEIDFLSVGGSEVKGEWMETIGEPQYNITYEQGMLIVRVRVKGKVREIVSAKIDIKALVLRNGTDDRFESYEFRDGDDLYLSFVSPVSGYLAVYLVDTDQTAYCLLPYRNQTDGIYRVKANQRYVFFKETTAPIEERTMVDEYTMTCSRSSEQNNIYVLFSPNQYTKAADNHSGELLPRDLSFEKFQKWLHNIRTRDNEFLCKTYTINVSKQDN